MTLSMYAVSIPLFSTMLERLLKILEKAEAYAAERKFKPEVLLSMRLAPDMLPFSFQIQNVTDRAKLCAARLAGQSAPVWEDTETTIPELKARLQKAIDYLATFKPEDIDGSESKEIPLKVNGQDVVSLGQDYLLNNVIPQFYFHVTTAYAMLRHSGVPIGKRDYLA